MEHILEHLDIITRIVEILGAATASCFITRAVTIRQRLKQEKAKTDADNIENIKNIVNDVYQPIIDDLKKQVGELREEVHEVREDNRQLQSENQQLRADNEKLRQDNEVLQDAIRAINPELIPSRRSINAQTQARGTNGRFEKKEE